MSLFQMICEYPVQNSVHGLLLPGDEVEADENPDPHFFEAVVPAPAPAPVPEPTPEETP